MFIPTKIISAALSSIASYANSTIRDYAFKDDIMQAETVGDRKDMVQLARAFRRVALKSKNNQSVVVTTNKFEDSRIRLFMVCDFTNWKENCWGDCKRDQCKDLCLTF